MGNVGNPSISVLAQITDYSRLLLFEVTNFIDYFRRRKHYYFLIQEEDKSGSFSRSNVI